MCVDPAQAHPPHIAFRFLLRIHCLPGISVVFVPRVHFSHRADMEFGRGRSDDRHMAEPSPCSDLLLSREASLLMCIEAVMRCPQHRLSQV